MGIRFYCPDCGRRLNIKAFLAGKRGICPHCDARVRILLESQIPDNAPKFRPIGTPEAPAAQVAAAVVGGGNGTAAELPGRAVAESSSDPIAEAPESVWYVRPPSGGQFGPARGDVMRKWLTEGRVSADSMVWREGWADWQLAGPVFPSLQPADDAPHPVIKIATSSAPEPTPSIVIHDDDDDDEQDISEYATARRRGSKKSLAPLIILGSLIVVLIAVTFVILMRQS